MKSLTKWEKGLMFVFYAFTLSMLIAIIAVEFAETSAGVRDISAKFDTAFACGAFAAFAIMSFGVDFLLYDGKQCQIPQFMLALGVLILKIIVVTIVELFALAIWFSYASKVLNIMFVCGMGISTIGELILIIRLIVSKRKENKSALTESRVKTESK